jgi:NTP pyrophosphatase (non-canonical NTP hydrolase)
LKLDDINLRLASWYKNKIGVYQNPQRDMVKLTEEVGELAKGVLKGDKPNIQEEIADVGIILLHLCRYYGWDFLEAVSDKVDILEERLRVFNEERYGKLDKGSIPHNQ